MGLIGWLKRRRNDGSDPRLAEWHRTWREALPAISGQGLADLTRSLDALGLPEEEIELEREMLEGVQQLAALREAVSGNGLPVITTGHRVVGHDTCHFSVPASMPDDPAQPSGRLLVTSARVVFVGGARATIVPWHAVAETAQDTRDLLLVRNDREALYRFRCNSYADALCGEFLARHLSAARRRGGPA